MKLQYKLFSIILAGGLLTACSSDEPQGNQLPEGKYPLQVSASVGAPESRSAGIDAWTGDGSEAFGVRIGADGTVGKYVICDAAGNAKVADGSSPLYWNNTEKATITAWLPYDAQTDVDISDQSAGFAAYDYLAATADGQSYLAPVSLQFTHKMAKVRCVLKAGKGVTDADLSAATVKFAGYTSATFTEGTLTGNGNGWITPAADREALLVPQNMTGKEFITIEMGGKEYVYTPADEKAGLLKAGLLHQYTVTVNSGSIEVSAVTGASWTTNAYAGILVTTYYDGTETDPKPGDYYYSDGTWSDGGLRKFGADNSMEWANPLPEPVSSKTVIGIVFFGGHNSNDRSDYTDSSINQEKCHGYVVSLTDAGTEKYEWSTDISEFSMTMTDISDWSGYSNQQIISLRNGNLNNYPGFKICNEFGQGTVLAAPAGTSGWYLPTCGQLLFIAEHNTLATIISKANGTAFQSETYWTSTEVEMELSYDHYKMIGAYEVDFSTARDGYNFNKRSQNRVRPVLSF